jgi:hypothetical protein
MGFLDDAKNKIEGLVGGHGDKVKEGLDKAGDLADDKTGGKYGDQIDGTVDKAKDAVDGLDQGNA